jgi:hypothetical protein
MVIQSIISRAVDENDYVAMASSELTAAFQFKVRHLELIGLPSDIFRLVRLWQIDHFMSRLMMTTQSFSFFHVG